ncbi:MAG: ribosome small subunit-dependent GTPase A [Eubacteriales bacterium]
MEYKTQCRVLRGVGGLYYVKLDEGDTPISGRTVLTRARGALRTPDGGKLKVGDIAEFVYSDNSFTVENGVALPKDDSSGLPDGAISTILPRKNSLIRPPLSNLDILIIVCASAAPAPATETIDKLLSVAEYHGIEAAVVIGKCELDPERADTLEKTYRSAGYPTFRLSCYEGEGIAELAEYIKAALPGRSAAFAGASGVGKSTLINALFPEMKLAAGEVSKKISRGKHTTRQAELFALRGGFLADTPGFSMIDFENFDFFPFEALKDTMREFREYYGECRYQDCSHTKEDGCAVLAAVERGEIAASRHESYLSMYRTLKAKPRWEKKQ